MVDHIGSWETFVFLGLGSEAVAITSLFLLFRSRGWIGPPRPKPPRRRRPVPVK
jgi:hypothetical protein